MNIGERLYLQDISAAEVLLNTEVTGVLPVVVLEREQASLGADLLLDLLDGNLLVLGASDGSAVAVSTLGPADLGDVGTLLSSLGAHLGGLGELLSSKVTSHLGGDGRGEVWVDLDGEDVDVVAERGALLLPGADGLGGGDGNVRGEAAALELLADVVDVRGELAGLAVVVEHALVANDDHGDVVLGCLVLDVLELSVGVAGEGTLATGTATLKEDTVDDLEAVLLALRNDILEDTAVGAVRTDGGEAHLGDLLDVILDITSGLALAVLGIGSVGHGPLVAVGDNVAGAAVATGRLGLVSSLGAGGDRLGRVRRGRSGLAGLLLGGSRRVDLSGLGGLWLSRGSRVDRRRGSWGGLHGDGRDLDGGVLRDGSLGLLSLGARSGRGGDPGGVGDDRRH